MQPVKISVVIPAYNEEKLIGRCIEAVKKQTYPKDQYEILVIDNNSTDRTSEIAQEKGAKVIPYKEKQGFAVTKQFGSYQAKGEIIAYTDADSLPAENWLETVDKIFQNKKLVYIGGTILSSGGRLGNVFFKLFDYFAVLNQLFGISLVWSPNMAVRKSAFCEVGGFDTEVQTSDDWVFTLRLQKKFGIRSTLYTNKLQVKTSPRKQKAIIPIIIYELVGVLNYFSIFIFRQSKTFGKPVHIR